MRSRNWSRFSDFIAVRPDKKANKKVGFRPLIGKRTLHLSIHLSSGFEKLDEQRSALGPENALLDGNRVVEKARVSDLELTAPPKRRSRAPKTRRRMRAWTRAPAHMGQGSRVQ